MTLPEGIQDIRLSDGRITASVAPALAAGRLAVEIDGIPLPLLASDEAGPEAQRFLQPFPFEPGRLVAGGRPEGSDEVLAPNRVCSALLNGLPDWTLSNGRTLQIGVYDRNRSIHLQVAGSIELPPQPVPRLFRAWLGIHRGDADLLLHVTDRETGQTHTETVPFDPDCPGGRARKGYQEVAVELPASDSPREIAITLFYKGYRQVKEDNMCFLFLADPEISDLPETRTVEGPHPVRPQVRQRILSGTPQPETVRCSLATPALGLTRAPVALLVEDERSVIFTPRSLGVRLTQDFGHTLMMAATEAADLFVYVDGQPGGAAYVGTEPTAVRLPADRLDGQVHHVALRDAEGVQVFFETFVMAPRILTPEEVMLRETRVPFPMGLSPRESHRYEMLRDLVGRAPGAAELAQAAHALRTLEGGYDNVELTPLAFPEVEAPDVSVIVPVHNKIAVTYSCLCALLLARNAASFEVILVDDASTDETARIESFVSGITVLRNSETQRFIRACNAGVARARAEHVVLLNNDTEPTAGWLDALLDAFDRFPSVGVAGSKLIYPDGKLQDGGGIFWRNGNPWNYGNSQNPWEPRFSYARQADYLCGAALMTTRAVWDEVGGLSAYLEPMYFEDADYAFKVREAGYTTWFIPASVVYHCEGKTAGRDVTTGAKRYQEVNRPKFKDRWAEAFAGFGEEGHAPDLEKDRGIAGRVLFVDYTTPRADRDAGGYAAIEEMKLIRQLGYKVTFLPENMAHLGSYTRELEAMGIEVATAPFYLSMDDFIARRGAEFDAFYIMRYYVGRSIIPRIRQVAPEARILFNLADLHFLRLLRTAIARGDAEMLETARTTREEELAVMREVDLVLSYNEVEHAVIESHTDGAVKVATCPWVLNIPDEVPPLPARHGISFLGSFNHHPNVEGVDWFVREAMPGIAEGAPGLKLSVYGSNMKDEVRALASDNVLVTGYIKDVATAYDMHRIFVAPLLSGAGIKGKVLAALAHGLPSVLSPVAAEGIGLRHEHDCLIARSPADWVEAVLRLERDDALWARLSANGRAFVTEHFSPRTALAQMRAAFEAAGLTP